ncbi:MAG: nucleotidyltransferase family protein [Candidatus Hydrogenedentes bacterium]|nr:nucleotidyltransferase family protein [Candidatus Hydrogenedentota bacterium]
MPGWVRSSRTLDLNWRLTANAGVGPVEQDLDEAWARAISVSNHEYVLAPEDELLYLLRHLSHGHDFARGIVRGCADLEAFFSHHTFLDFDYFRAQAQRAESLRAIAFVLHFFTHEFVSSQPLPPVLEQLLAVHEQEARCFSRAVIWPLMQLREHNRPTALLVRRNWGLFAKAWAVDSPARVRWLWRVILRPTPEERLLITGHAAPATLRAHVAWFSHMLFMAPGLVLGMLARLIMPLSDKAGRRVAVNTREAPHELL